MESIWMRGMEETHYPSIVGNMEVDTLIIGGGMAGILTARKLRSSGVDCAVVDAGRIGMSVTARTTAVISAQHGTLYSELVDKLGVVRAKMYLRANLNAVEEFKRLGQEIDCDYEVRASLIYSMQNGEKLKREVQTVNSLGYPAYFTQDVPLLDGAAGAVVFPDMGQIHPLKLLRGAAAGLRIYENSPVRAVKGMTAHTDAGSVKAKNIVIASHFPFIDRRGMYFMKLHQRRESVVALENAPKLDITAVEDKKDSFFFRSYGDILIVGHGNRLPGDEDDDFAKISLFLKKYAPNARQVCRWINQDCFSLDGVPYIGRYSQATPHIFVATGFNAWGMTSSMVAAEIISEAILGRQSQFSDVFQPNRPMEPMPLMRNAVRSAAGLLTPTVPRCSHLGCALKYNSSEHTWDCPCHGSRFTQSGAVLSGPASKGIKVSREK